MGRRRETLRRVQRRLGVSRLDRTRASWNERLAGGFVVDFAVNPDATADPERAMAELTVELEGSGDWFGGGH